MNAIPWFFTFSKGTTPETDSWSVQCEVLQATLLGAMPQDEDQPPENPDLLDDFNPEHFEFFGFGQPRQGPPFQPPADLSATMQIWPKVLIGIFGPIHHNRIRPQLSFSLIQ